MGDYYKYKKILVILMIISCGFSIIKNIFKSNVYASEAVEVTPTWNDSSYTNQSDNNYLTLMNNQLQIQERIIGKLLDNLSNNRTDDLITQLRYLKQRIYLEWNGNLNRSCWFSLYTGEQSYSWYYQEITTDKLNNIVFNDATLNDGYKITNVPFYSATRNWQNSVRYFNSSGVMVSQVATGDFIIPCAELGYYSYHWVDVFKAAGLIDSVEYNDILADIEETNELNYTQNYYTKQAVQNTYSYITNDNVDTISSSGITQPQVTEPDISDAFDSLSDLLTNDNATTKFFTFTLPNGTNHVFALSPDFLRNCLTRVGGGELVTIIETLWYIGLYGLMIFTGLKIIGALLSGDLDAVTGVLSPVNSVVNSSLEVTGAFRTAGGDESAFRIRKG